MTDKKKENKVVYSPAQHRAIKLKDKNIVVSAQAGAGKTMVLVDRIIRIFTEEKIDIDSMLIVTFTNKAAGEMKDRIRRALLEKSNQDDENSMFFKRQYTRINDAQISTMHSFCINILRDYFYKIDLNPKFKVLNQTSLDIIRWEAMEKVFSDFYQEENEDFLSFINSYGAARTDIWAKDMIFEIYEFIQSQVNPFSWLEKHIEGYPKSFDDIDSQAQKKRIMDYISSAVKIHIKFLYRDLDEMERAASGGATNPYLETVEEDRALLDKFVKTIREKDFDGFIEILANFKFARLKRVSTKGLNEADLDRVENFKKRRNSFKKKFNKVFSEYQTSFEEILGQEIKTRKVLDTILMILRAYDREFKNRKAEKQGLDFSDLEHLAVELLQDQEVVDQLREKYKYIFFDEYQDANQVQDYIVEKIKREDNLFFVGDIKQSIYRFRLADPLLFLDRYNSYKNDETGKSEAIDLSENYRSIKDILSFNNFIFNILMTEDIGEIVYDSPEHRLRYGNTSLESDEDKTIEFYVIDDDIDEEIIADNPRMQEARGLAKEDPQAFFIARYIKEQIDQGKRPRDFGVLLRKRSLIPEICEYLRLFDIPFFSESVDFTYEDLELLNFINLLKAIDNDKRDLVLLSVLLSNFGNFTEEEIALIRADKKDESFHKTFYESLDREDLSDEIKDKVRAYMKKRQEFARLEKIMSLSDFAWYVLEESGYKSYILASPDGKKKYDNLLAFIDEIEDYEQDAKPGLYNFLNYVDDLMDRDLSDLQAGADLSDDDDVVRIMTMHKSKGLQFEHVILADLQSQFNKRDLSSMAVMENDMGIAVKLFDPVRNKLIPSFSYNIIKNIKYGQALSEEARILYVAMTRAKSKLTLVGASRPSVLLNRLYDDFWNASSFLDWLGKIIIEDHISDDFKYRLEQSDKAIDRDLKSRILTHKVYYDQANFQKKQEEFERFLKDESIDLDKMDPDTEKLVLKKKPVNLKEKFDMRLFLSSEIFEDKYSFMRDDKLDIDSGDKKSEYEYVFDFSYPYKDQTNLAYKKTVSELSRKNDNTSSDFKAFSRLAREDEILADYKRPNFIQEDKSLSPAEYGTIVHKIFQRLPIKEYSRQSLDRQLERLIFEGLIDQDIYDKLNREDFLVFFNSDLAKKAREADKIHREESFTMRYEDCGHEILVDGQIDMFFESQGKIYLIDFKTDRHIDKERYRRQVKLYKEGIEKASNKKVEKIYIYWVRHHIFTEY